MSNLHYPCVQVRAYDEYGEPVPALGSFFLQVEDIFHQRREPSFGNSRSSVNDEKVDLVRDTVPNNLHVRHMVSQVSLFEGNSKGASNSSVGNSPTEELRNNLEEKTVSFEGIGNNDTNRKRRIFLGNIAKDLVVDPDDIEVSLIGPGHPDYSRISSEGFPLPSKTVDKNNIIDLTKVYPMEDRGNTRLGSVETTQVIDLTGDELDCFEDNSVGDQDSGMALERESLFDFVKRCFPIPDMDGPSVFNTC